MRMKPLRFPLDDIGSNSHVRSDCTNSRHPDNADYLFYGNCRAALDSAALPSINESEADALSFR
jgi:hypothetical protein